ncbi:MULTISPECIES: amidase [Bradyrhizobium]|uniref:Asp-tRNA(Asn)/Glu-tRNA(Gln) amidotransferase A subunit family amidase n=1 Tax=Bradyrhizobium ottawaense TaxID=931866 RepID=A0ABV4G0G2_9BRAD|nr:MULTISPECIES: amidase [Bradyrhizobium]MBR1294187.1 amidase [Bradyrhizobium ottawaense]MBR1366255.1 amidase [Bradyrhizobium ottawaense]MDA9414562.1 amidase [Bradyrhizobium sp. CCBAU 25360]MDA9481796.1 amidase [Bradyrhizobium sp. CCBAU 11445]PDT66481.1 amidase [Bradyrhizobium ottawaense]
MISLADLQRRIEAGELSPEAAIAQSHAAIEAREKDVRAFVRHDKSAKAQASGPLRGIAVGIKDIIDTANMPTEMGSEIYRGWQPRADAPVVMMLKRAGATIIGKTTTTAFASRDPTPTLNPHNFGHSPGGSSAGSAAAVGAGMIPLALGTQTGGSVIRPAAYCGTAAIKPSFRMLPTVGVKCYSWALDTVGLFGARAEDLACGLLAMTGRSEFSGIVPAKAPRIGVVRQEFAGAVEPAAEEGLLAAVKAAERAGASVQTIDLPEAVQEAWRIHPIVQDFEAHRALAWEFSERHDEIAPMLRASLDATAHLTPKDYDEARRISRRGRRELGELFEGVDVLLTYSAPGTAPAKELATTGDPRYNRLWTLMGNPCVNVPVLKAGGLPIGVQVIARFGNDARALATAWFLEDALAKSG